MAAGSPVVLIVDDNAANRAVATATLEDEGYATLVATSGDEAIAQVERHRPQCILMDIRMPGIDGIEACARIRRAAGGAEIAIIFVTAQRDVATFDRALAADGDDFITKPFRTEELLMRVQSALRVRRIASERSEAVAELKQQRDRLQRLELQKEQLVAFLVHDLKNPVNAIDLHAQAILRAQEIARAHAGARRIRDDGRALTRMITNLLDISKADEGRLAPVVAAIDAASLVRDLVEEQRAHAEASGIELASDVQVATLVADPDLITRVLANLVDNAIRHAPEGSRVRVTAAPSADGVTLRVADAGAGIAPEERERVFERFLSGPSATRTNRGLGLAFCKLAVEAHGGRVWVEDASPGAAFCLSLPSAPPR